MTQSTIEANNIVKSYGKDDAKRTVVNDVSLVIAKSEFVSVMGPSGSGKSTLLYSISGMDQPDSGTVLLDGNDIASLSDKKSADIRRQKMGFIFQQPAMLKNLNIIDNIILTTVRDKKASRPAILERAHKLMKQTGIDHIATNQVSQVSGGELQRAGICRALMNEPSVIFADEPTGALNMQSATEIMKLLATIHEQGATLLLVTHDAKVAAHADRTLFMRDGTIVDELTHPQSKTPETITKNTQKILQKINDLGI